MYSSQGRAGVIKQNKIIIKRIFYIFFCFHALLQTVALGYFTAQRLAYINETVAKLQPNLTNLLTSTTDSLPLNTSLAEFRKDIELLNRKVLFGVTCTPTV